MSNLRRYTFWLILQLCFSPKTAYRHTAYNKQTKNQWSRDDPAYLIVSCLFVAVSSLTYCIAVRAVSFNVLHILVPTHDLCLLKALFGKDFWSTIIQILSSVFIDFLFVGCCIASIGWVLANKFLRKKNINAHTTEQQVEWLYAFDIHCNAFFPMFLLIYVLQYVLLPVLLHDNVLSIILANILYGIAFCYYPYLSFLGYSALPFLEQTEVLLWPALLVILLTPFAILLQFNPTRHVLELYFK